MRIVRIILSIISVICIVLSNNCTVPSIKECVGHVKMSKNLKAYTYFKDSSYWIYKDSITGDLDSFWVKNSRVFDYWPKKETGTNNTPCYEKYEYRLFSKKNGIYDFYLKAYYLSVNKRKTDLITFYLELWEVNSDLNGHKDYDNDVYYFIEKFDSLDIKKYSNNFVSDTFYKNLQVSGILYNNVIYSPVTIGHTELPIYKLFHAKNIGMIKFYDYNNHPWELIKYKINQ